MWLRQLLDFRPSTSDVSSVRVANCTWTFARGDQRLEIYRMLSERGPELVLIGDEAPQTARFDNLTALVIFQSDMEKLLMRTGWCLVGFSPERRVTRDRRRVPRLGTDRRRWWTDVTFPTKPR